MIGYKVLVRILNSMAYTSIKNLKKAAAFAILSLLVSLFGAPAFAEHLASGDANKSPRLAIIIDDIGNHYELGKRAINLPGKITYAILPDTPQGSRLANYVSNHAKDKEVILHMPMEAKGGQVLGNLGLYDELQQAEFSERLRLALEEIPNVKGVSNHMGSHLTLQKEKMGWLMAELQPRSLFFVDSKTTKTSAAREAATEHHVPYISRDVFLDHHREIGAVQRSFEKAIQTAKRDGLAVLIGHPYRLTLGFLERELPKLKDAGVELVNISSVIQEPVLNQQLAVNAFVSDLQYAGQNQASSE